MLQDPTHTASNLWDWLSDPSLRSFEFHWLVHVIFHLCLSDNLRVRTSTTGTNG